MKLIKYKYIYYIARMSVQYNKYIYYNQHYAHDWSG